jgi:hypothetical protein
MIEYEPRWEMARWIAIELGEDLEDIYDVLLGNITEPRDLVNNVEQLSQNYYNEKSRFPDTFGVHTSSIEKR